MQTPSVRFPVASGVGSFLTTSSQVMRFQSLIRRELFLSPIEKRLLEIAIFPSFKVQTLKKTSRLRLIGRMWSTLSTRTRASGWSNYLAEGERRAIHQSVLAKRRRSYAHPPNDAYQKRRKVKRWMTKRRLQ